MVFQEAIKQSCYKVNRRWEKVLLGTILLPWCLGIPCFCHIKKKRKEKESERERERKVRIDKRKKTDLPNANA